MRTPLIAGNWKMNGTTDFSMELLGKIKAEHDRVVGVEFAVFPPFVYLDLCQKKLHDTSIAWGAQNVSDRPNGALTGEISTAMLQDLGCRYVIVGHSERRHIMGESNEQVALKVQAALKAGIKPVLCVGETLAQREAGKTWDVVQEQLAHILRLKDNLPALDSMVIAYEPVWAIGTGKTATPEQAEQVHAAIRSYCNSNIPVLGESLRILYGGSVNPENAQSLFAMPNIDGALIGGASLKANQFIEIGRQWNK